MAGLLNIIIPDLFNSNNLRLCQSQRSCFSISIIINILLVVMINNHNCYGKQHARSVICVIIITVGSSVNYYDNQQALSHNNQQLFYSQRSRLSIVIVIINNCFTVSFACLSIITIINNLLIITIKEAWLSQWFAISLLPARRSSIVIIGRSLIMVIINTWEAVNYYNIWETSIIKNRLLIITIKRQLHWLRNHC